MWLLVIGALTLLALYLYKLNDTYHLLAFCKRFKTIDGSKLEDRICVVRGKTIFGNNLDFFKLTPDKIFEYSRLNNITSKGKSYVLYILNAPAYNITNAEDVEELFQSTTVLRKSVVYNGVKPFLGDGLLISSAQKWHSRRKMLTPAFHFNVLQSFNEVFKEESLKLLKRLLTLQNEKIDLADIISEFTLNNVCETALGVKLDNVNGSAQYRKTIHDIELVIIERVHNPLMLFDAVFKIFGDYEKHQKDLKIAHTFASEIIEKKRQEYQAKKKQQQEQEVHEKVKNTDNDYIGQKKRYAMLDTLLDEEAKGHIDHQGICDEVNTFMFEGYDTTSTCLIYTIMNLALHPDIQDKCRQEVQNLDDFSALSVFDFNNLTYLECVLKETLRLYPSVPFAARTCDVETRMNGLILPKNSQINIHIFDIMRDPKHFPDPLTFKPERFLPENSATRHPFAFVPFSAGSRNCIGQKFALLEMKAMLVAILKNFQILPVTTWEDLTFETGLVLRTQQKAYVKLKKI